MIYCTVLYWPSNKENLYKSDSTSPATILISVKNHAHVCCLMMANGELYAITSNLFLRPSSSSSYGSAQCKWSDKYVFLTVPYFQMEPPTQRPAQTSNPTGRSATEHSAWSGASRTRGTGRESRSRNYPTFFRVLSAASECLEN